MRTTYVNLAQASRLLAVGRSTTYRWAAEGKLGQLQGTRPTRVSIAAVEALAGPKSLTQIDRTRREQLARAVERVWAGPTYSFRQRLRWFRANHSLEDLRDLQEFYDRKGAWAALKKVRMLIRIQIEAEKEARYAR